MRVSILCMETADVGSVINLAERAEAAGLHGLWLGTALGFDPFVALAAVAGRTSTLQLGTAVVPTWPRHPIATAQQAATLDVVSGGRFRLGVGPSHEPAVTGIYGLEFSDPVGHTREYVEILQALLDTGRVKHDGRHYRVRASLEVTGAGRPPVLISALHERMSRMAGAVADGVLPWLAPPDHIAKVVVPAVAAGAAEAGRPAPPVIAGFPVLLTGDPAEGREAVRRAFGLSARMPSYQRLLCATDEESWIDAALGAVVAWGTPDDVRRRAEQYAAAGATEIMVAPMADFQECLGALGAGDPPWPLQR